MCTHSSSTQIHFCQTLGLVLRLRVDLVLPLSQEEEQEEEEQEEEEPSPKSISGGVLEGRNLTHGLLMGFWLSLWG